MTFKKSQVTALYGEFQTADAKLDHLYSNGGTDTEIEATYAHIMRSASALCDAKPETYKEVALQLRFVQGGAGVRCPGKQKNEAESSILCWIKTPPLHLDGPVVVQDHVLEEPAVGLVLPERCQSRVERVRVVVHGVAAGGAHVRAASEDGNGERREASPVQSQGSSSGKRQITRARGAKHKGIGAVRGT